MQRSDQLWSRTTLRPLFKYYVGGGWGSESASVDYFAPAAVIRGTDIPGALIGNVQSIPRRFHKSSNLKSRKLQVGDLIFEVSGGSKDQPVGRALYCSDRLLVSIGGNVIPASFCKRIVPDATLVDGRFIYYVLRCLYDDRRIAQWQVQSTGISNFQFEAFLDECEVDLPPLETQRRIASILSAFDDLIENNTRRIAILEEMARRLYEEWFVRFRFPGHEQVTMVESELGLIPEEWQRLRMGDFCDVTDYVANGSFASLKENVTYCDDLNYAILVRTKDYGADWSGSFVYVTERSYRFLKKSSLSVGDIVVGNVGNAGMTFRVPDLGQPMTLGPNAITVRPREYRAYVYEYLCSNIGQGLIKGIVSGAAQPKFNKTEFRKLFLPLPTEDLLAQYEETAESLWQLKENLRKKNANLRATRDLLLPKLISGELDVSSLPKPEEAIAA